MIARISPSVLNGSCMVPPSKSVMQRVCALALLNEGITRIHSPGNSDDDKVAIGIISQFGATVDADNGSLIITSNGFPGPKGDLDCGESGLSLRMFAALAALCNESITLKGRGSLCKRPQHFIDEVFPKLGVEVKSAGGFLPIGIKGPMVPASLVFDASQSSQYLTGLLFAIARVTQQPITLTVNNLQSKPYIALSLSWMKRFGYMVTTKDFNQFIIEPIPSPKRNMEVTIDGDWSGAAFLLVAAAITGEVTVNGLLDDSLQADRAIINVLKDAGAEVIQTQNTVNVFCNSKLKAFEFDAHDCPDLFPPLVALALSCEGISTIKAVSRLVDKESNRAVSLQQVFQQLGVTIRIEEDSMFISGPVKVMEGSVSSHGDHRVAMAVTVAALNGLGTVEISGAEAVNKSFPDFFSTLSSLGASLSLYAE